LAWHLSVLIAEDDAGTSFGGGLEAQMSKFKVAIVERGKEDLWRDYWVNSQTRGTAGEAPSGLGRTEVVEATSLDEAIDAVQRRHPDCAVMLAGGEHHDA
jgi:hypothetical protein